jgi:magnesium chelatase family protein
MLATALSATLLGLDAYPVRVEVEARRGPPHFELVGLAEAAVRESRVRVRSALQQVGVETCECVLIVNLAPADLRKTGSAFDLAIAAASLAALGAVPAESLAGVFFLGELSLGGEVQAVRGVLPHLLGARARGIRHAVVPRKNEAEAALVEGMTVRTVASLLELVAALKDEARLPRAVGTKETEEPLLLDDLLEVRGQGTARRALEIAAAGGHNLLMIGPPGSGKTMLARRLPSVLPALEHDEALEVAAIHSVAGLLSRGLPRARPFRAPHHTVTDAGLVGGGGDGPRPGEVTLAHHGVLFLDELPEFRRTALEALRQPLEDGHVTISRARAKAILPARPMVVAAMNPCPCGYQGGDAGRCRCAPERVAGYRARLSGPLLDRIDVHVTLPPVHVTALQGGQPGEPSAGVRARVERARDIQRARQGTTNAALPGRELERHATLCKAGQKILAEAMTKLGLSARAYNKVLRVARTIADLAGGSSIRPDHISEALTLRVLDRSPLPVAA